MWSGHRPVENAALDQCSSLPRRLFNLKFGAGGPLTGVMIVLAELAMFALPTSPVQFFPGFFFGGLMLWLGIDIMYDWLVTAVSQLGHQKEADQAPGVSYTRCDPLQAASWNRLRKFEYALIWVTFVAVTVYGLEGGILIGIVSAMAIFAYEYSKLSVTCFNVAASRSSYMRTYHQRFVLDVRGDGSAQTARRRGAWLPKPTGRLLTHGCFAWSQRLSSNMVAISLSGYIFFGSATVISHNALRIADILLKSSTEEESSVDQGSRHESPDMEVGVSRIRSCTPLAAMT